MRAVQRARLWAITAMASEAPLAANQPNGRWSRPTPSLGSRMAFLCSLLARLCRECPTGSIVLLPGDIAPLEAGIERLDTHQLLEPPPWAEEAACHCTDREDTDDDDRGHHREDEDLLHGMNLPLLGRSLGHHRSSVADPTRHSQPSR